MKYALVALSLMAGIMGVSAESHAYIVNFESLAHADDQIASHGASYLENVYLFTNTATVASSGFAPAFSTLGSQVNGYSGSTALFNDNYGGTTVLTRANNGTFNLNSISLAELLPSDVSFNVSFSGVRTDGTTVARVFTLDGTSGAQSFSFGSDFVNLVSASWNQDADFHQFDDVDVTPTPLPAAFWLLSSGLAGLAGIRRRS